MKLTEKWHRVRIYRGDMSMIVVVPEVLIHRGKQHRWKPINSVSLYLTVAFFLANTPSYEGQ